MMNDQSMFDPGYYDIKVKGRLDSEWSNWFEGMTISYKKGVTTMSGKVVDQAALHGLLIRIRDMGLKLISVNRIESDSGKCIHQIDEHK